MAALCHLPINVTVSSQRCRPTNIAHFKHNQREDHVAGLTFQEALAFSTAKSALNNVAYYETNKNISYAHKE
jgi:hypothetical protein